MHNVFVSAVFVLFNKLYCLTSLFINLFFFKSLKGECYQNYNGALCENLLCSVSQPVTCADFTVAQCSVAQIYNYCPILCGNKNSF